jgi:hypothetical protein
MAYKPESWLVVLLQPLIGGAFVFGFFYGLIHIIKWMWMH